jgi:HAD superfamily hydrolase (TIGR01549 family)
MKPEIHSAYHSTIVFDCDGVVLNSNWIKTEAFYQSTLAFGESAAQAMVDYHVANGGVSRYVKFAHFLEHIAPTAPPATKIKSLEQLLVDYSVAVKQGLLECEIADRLDEFRQQTQDARWIIVSGGDQGELREVFAARGIADWFDGGIFGSPDSKPEILVREIASGNIQRPAIFFGDSQYDYQSAKDAGLDFLFIHGWTDVADWQRFVSDEAILSVTHISDALRAIRDAGGMDVSTYNRQVF